MALLKKYLDCGIKEYSILDNNHTHVQPKKMCNISEVPEDFQELLDEFAQEPEETICLKKSFIKDLEERNEVSLRV
jgi:hypothetical protein